MKLNKKSDTHKALRIDLHMLGIWLLVRYSVLPDFTREADTRQTYFHIALEGDKRLFGISGNSKCNGEKQSRVRSR